MSSTAMTMGKDDTGKGQTRAQGQGQEGEVERARANKGARVDMVHDNGSSSGDNAAATTGYRGVRCGGKDGECTATAAARTGNARQQRRRQGRQQGPGRGQCGGNNSSEIRGDTVTTAVRMIARETHDKTRATWRRQQGDIAVTAVARPTVMVVARVRAVGQRQRGTAATVVAVTRTTARATVVRMGNAGATMEAASLISPLFSFFLVGLRTRSRGLLFRLIHNCHMMTHKPQYACTRELAYFVG